MLPIQFFEENVHFAISLFAAFVFFAVFWLYFDAWQTRHKKSKLELLKWAGFLTVSVGFIFNATIIEQANFGHSIFGGRAATVASILRIIGYLAIAIGQLMSPVQIKPVTKGVVEEIVESEAAKRSSNTNNRPSAFLFSGSAFGTVYVLPIAALVVAVAYWRQATKGLERHLKPVALAFLLLFGFELLNLAVPMRSTLNPNFYNLVKAFGPLWITSYVLLFAASVVLGRWVWQYLTERFFSQLFMIFTGAILVIFVVTAVSFTYLLIHNVQNDDLNNMQTAANVLNYALNSKKTETMDDAQAVAANPAVAQAITAGDHSTLSSLTASDLANKQLAGLDITNSVAEVLQRAENTSSWGDSVSSNPMVRKALAGTSGSTIASQSGILAPALVIQSYVPVYDSNHNVIGTVMASVEVNNAFVDGIKNATGLDSSIYADNVLSATTLVAPDGITRWVGVKEVNQSVLNTVIQKNQVYKGSLSILNQQYLAVYVPLTDASSNVVGMLFAGQPSTTVLQTSANSVQLTFIITAILLGLSIIPAYYVSKHIAKQLG